MRPVPRPLKPAPVAEPALVEEPLPETLRDLRFAVVDLETTGGRPVADWDGEGRFRPASEITEMGVVTATGPILETRAVSLCAVEGSIPSMIQNLTGITPRMLAGAPPWEQVALRMMPLLEGRIWVAHNAGFDGSFLQAYLPEGFWKRHRLICTVKLARKLVPEAPSRSLGALVTHLGLSNARPHRALEDAEATAELLQHLLDRAQAAGWTVAQFLAVGATAWKKSPSGRG